jgi:hypothetical protein
MPVHDWQKVPAGLFHHFHQDWSISICRRLNAGILSDGYDALVEQRAGGLEPDVVTDLYAQKANEVAIRSRLGRLVAMIEIVSPGNKANAHALRMFIEKTLAFLRQGINVAVIDLLPPSRRDPQGIHPLIWGEIRDEPFQPQEKPLTMVSYTSGPPPAAYVEWAGVGDVLPDLPVFLNAQRYVTLPLEATYLTTWESCPKLVKAAVPQT